MAIRASLNLALNKQLASHVHLANLFFHLWVLVFLFFFGVWESGPAKAGPAGPAATPLLQQIFIFYYS